MMLIMLMMMMMVTDHWSSFYNFTHTEHQSHVFRDVQADDNPLATTLVQQYKEQMEAAIKQLVAAQAETATLRVHIESLESQNRDLRDELDLYRGSQGRQSSGTSGGSASAPPPPPPPTAPPAAAAPAGRASSDPPVSQEERELLAKYVTAISESEEGNLVEEMIAIIKVY